MRSDRNRQSVNQYSVP